MVDPRTSERDQSLGGNTSTVGSVGSSLVIMSSMTPNIVTTTHPVAARPSMITNFRQYVPSFSRETHEGVIPTFGQYVPSFARNKHEYGMPTGMMEGLHNSNPTFGENFASTFSPYHTSGPLGN